MDKFYTNFIYLIIIKGTNFVFPYLLTAPYLARTLGEGKFGKIAFTVGFMGFLMAFVEYGFNLTATRDLTIHKDNPQKVNEIYNTVLACKLVLFTVSVLVALVVIFGFKFFRDDYLLYVSSLLLVLGQALLPIWFFQGVNNLKPMAIVNLGINIIVFGVMFLMVKTTEDYLLVNIIQGLGWVLASFICMIIAKKQYDLHFYKQKWQILWAELKASFGIFLTNFLYFLIITLNIFILGFFVQGKGLDDYSYAEKIYTMLHIFPRILYVVVYSKVHKIAIETPSQVNPFLIKLGVKLGICFLILGGILFVLAPEAILILTGKNSLEAIVLLRIIAFSPLFYALSIPISHKILLNKQEKTLSLILVFTILFNLCINFILVPLFNEMGTAISLLLTEIVFFLLVSIVLSYQKSYNKNESISCS